MKVYKFDLNGYFAGVHDCQPCPLTGEWLYPTEGTFTDEEPEIIEGFINQWDGKGWTNIKNYFQKPLYNVKTKDIGYCQSIEKPEGYTDIEPTDVQKWDGKKWVDDTALIAEKEKKLKLSAITATDSKMSRALEDVIDTMINKSLISKTKLPLQTQEIYDLKKVLRDEYNGNK